MIKVALTLQKMNKYIKKIFLLLILVLSVKGFGQRYTLHVISHAGYCGSTSSIMSYDVRGINEGEVGTSLSGKWDTEPNRPPYDITIPRYDKYVLITNITCENYADQCDVYGNLSITFLALLKGGGMYWEDCRSGVSVYNLIPIGLSIKNAENSSEICAGELLNLSASHITNIIFPDDVYHWQYSLNNQATWVDLPYPFNLRKNNLFTIQEILGSTHDRYFNKQIYFRLGYGQGPDFTTPLAITYSPCGPTIDSIAYLGPECNGDKVKSLAITFKDKLDATIGEKLASIAVCDINNSIIRMQINGSISYPDDTKTYTYAATDLQQLENGHTYKIRYQAQIPDPKDPTKIIMRGVLDSAINFQYNEPEPLTFSLARTNPLCHDENGKVTINVSGGTTPYSYILDNQTEVINGNTVPKKNTFLGTSTTIGLTPTGHIIKVTDDKGCIEKNVKQ